MLDPSTVNNRIAESVRTMKALHSVVCGVALTSALGRLLDPSAGLNRIDRAAWLFSVILTIIPFHYGALRHVDDVYLHRDPAIPRPRQGALLLDFAFLFSEACSLYYLAHSVPSLSRFVPVYLTLLSLDVCWAISVSLVQEGSAAVRRWMFINLVFGIGVLVAASLGPLDGAVTRDVILGLVIVRTIVDYTVSWSFYFPTVPQTEPTNAAAGA